MDTGGVIACERLECRLRSALTSGLFLVRALIASTNSNILEAKPLDLLRIVEITSIKEPVTVHRGLELFKIYLLELIPLRHDDDRICIFDSLKG